MMVAPKSSGIIFPHEALVGTPLRNPGESGAVSTNQAAIESPFRFFNPSQNTCYATTSSGHAIGKKSKSFKKAEKVKNFCTGILEILGHRFGLGEVIDLGAEKYHTIREFAGGFDYSLNKNPEFIYYEQKQCTSAENKSLSVPNARRWILWKPADMSVS